VWFRRPRRGARLLTLFYVSTSSARGGLPLVADHVDPESAGRLVAWTAAIACGRARPHEAAAAIEAGTDGHVADDVRAGVGEEPILETLSWLCGPAVRGVVLVLPVAGDPLGCGGGGVFTQAAVLAEQAVVVQRDGGAGNGRAGNSAGENGAAGDDGAKGATSIGLVPAPDFRGSSYRGVRWQAYPDIAVNPALNPPVTMAPDRIVEQADRALRRALREATASLDAVDLARWRADAVAGRAAADVAMRSKVRGLPPGWPPTARDLSQRALALWRVLRVASADSGAASATASLARVAALRQLSHAVREAAMVAFNVPAAAMRAGGARHTGT
jgi:hypothetical protein